MALLTTASAGAHNGHLSSRGTYVWILYLLEVLNLESYVSWDVMTEWDACMTDSTGEGKEVFLGILNSLALEFRLNRGLLICGGYHQASD